MVREDLSGPGAGGIQSSDDGTDFTGAVAGQLVRLHLEGQWLDYPRRLTGRIEGRRLLLTLPGAVPERRNGSVTLRPGNMEAFGNDANRIFFAAKRADQAPA